MRRRRRALSNGQILLACVILGLFFAVAILAPQLAPPDDPDNPGGIRIAGESHYGMPLPPSKEAILGTGPGQFDIYYSLVWGTRSALRFGLVVAMSTAAIGVLLGAVSGYFGGRVHGLLTRISDGFLAFPVIAAVWLIVQVMTPEMYTEPTPIQQAFYDLHLSPVLLALILFSWMPYARLTSVNVIQLKQTEYVLAAKALGARDARIIGRHILPNALSPVIVLAARDVGAMVVLAAAFSFIGLGGGSEWGTILAMGRDYVIGLGGNPLAYWWVFVPATLALVLFGIGWNLLGDGLNTVLDPRIGR
ncbi:MAG: ABC transporter permease [Anaerolineae bacterium]|nr:ABC transporter permease [Anaerolineae bacterium]